MILSSHKWPSYYLILLPCFRGSNGSSSLMPVGFIRSDSERKREKGTAAVGFYFLFFYFSSLFLDKQR